MHFVRLANTFLKDEESAPDNHVYGGPQVPTFVQRQGTSHRYHNHTATTTHYFSRGDTAHYVSQCSVVSVV